MACASLEPVVVPLTGTAVVELPKTASVEFAVSAGSSTVWVVGESHEMRAIQGSEVVVLELAFASAVDSL